MSVSKWAYESWKCDGDFCPGDCDFCGKAYESYCEECVNEGVFCEDCEVQKEGA